MLKNLAKPIGIIVIILLFALQGCIKNAVDLNNLQNTSWSPNLAAPLINASLTVDDIIVKAGQQGSISVGSDNACTIVYQGTLYKVMAKDLIKFPSDTTSQSFSLTSAQAALYNLAGKAQVISLNQWVNFDAGTLGTQVDSVFFKSGVMVDSIVSTFPQTLSCTIKIPGAINAQGLSFSKTITANAVAGVPVVAYSDLSGYKFDMSNKGATSNTFLIIYEINVPYPISAGQIKFVQSLRDLQFDKFFGYMGQIALVPPKGNADTVNISIFKNANVLNAFTLSNPSVSFFIANSLGVPIKSTLSVIGYSSPKFQALSTGIPNPLPINSPSIKQIGQTMLTSFTLDNTTSAGNGGIAQLFNFQPKQLIYQLTSTSNPAGVTHNNFIMDTSSITLNMLAKIPLAGTAKNFTIMDTLSQFAVNLSGNAATVQSITLKMNIANGFPMGVNIQVLLTDSLYHTIDSLLSTPLIMSPANLMPNPSNNNTFIAASPAVNLNSFTLTGIHLTHLYAAKHAIVRGVLATAKSGNAYPNVEIYANNQLSVKVGVQAIVNYDLNKK